MSGVSQAECRRFEPVHPLSSKPLRIPQLRDTPDWVRARMILFTSTTASTRGRRSASCARHRPLATPPNTSRIPPPELTAPSTIWSPLKSTGQKWRRLLGLRAASSTDLSGVQTEFRQRIQPIVSWRGRPDRSQRLRLRRESPTPAPRTASDSGPGTALAFAAWVLMVMVS